MKKNIALLLLIFLTSFSMLASSPKETVESLNRKLPMGSTDERVLGKVIYDELNNIIVANYLTNWENLVQIRKQPDVQKKAVGEVLNLIFVENPTVSPFTLVVNYFPNESGFDDLAKTFIISPSQVAQVLKSVKKENKGKQDKGNTPAPEAETKQEKPNSPLDQLAARMAQFKGYKEAGGRFEIVKNSLSPDRKDIEITIVANDETLPFFIDDQYAPTMESVINSLLTRLYPEYESVFSTEGLKVMVQASDQQGNVKGQRRYPAANVFAKKTKENTEGQASQDKGKSNDEKKSRSQTSDQPQSQTPAQPETQQPQAAAQPQPQQSQQPQPQTVAQTQSQQPQTAEQPQTPQVAQDQSNAKATVDETFQKIITVYKSLLPENIADGMRIANAQANSQALILLVDVDGEKYKEETATELRDVLLRHLAKEFTKKKSMYPYLLNVTCQTGRQYIYVLTSKGWSKNYPIPLDPCALLHVFASTKAKAE